MAKPDTTIPLPHFPEHIGVVVKDIQATIRYLSSTYAIGDLQMVGDYSPSDEELLAGKDFAVKVATIKMGASKIELLQPLNKKSILAKFLDEHGEGLHHIAFETSRLDEVLSAFKEQGVEILLGGCVDGRRWVYFDTGSKPGGIITEFLEFQAGAT